MTIKGRFERFTTKIKPSDDHIDEANRRVTQLEIELVSMAGESDAVREPVERALADAREARGELAARWATEKGQLDRVSEITISLLR